MPEVRADYAGYVAWRGLVDEPELTDEAAALLRDRFSFFEYANSHMLAYLVPGEHEAIELGKRRYNWVWYRNAAENCLAELLIDAGGRQRASSIPPGLLSVAAETDLREAAARHPRLRQNEASSAPRNQISPIGRIEVYPAPQFNPPS
jgi:hypothetical protein